MIQPELKTPPADVTAAVTDKYTEAYNLNVRICVNAQVAQQNLYEVCKGLKEMHDGKLYKELGYQNFEEYTENEVGIKRLQARKYVSIASIENGQSTNYFEQLGTEKLYLLSRLDEPLREEIQQTTNLEDVSVRELKAKIDDLKKANDRLLEKVDESEKKAAQSRKSEEAACGKLSILQTDSEFQKQKIAQLESEISKKNDSITALEGQITDLENRPVEVAVEASHEEENLRKAINKLNTDFGIQISEMQEDNMKRIRSLNDEHNAEITKIKEEYEAKLAEVPQPESVPDTKGVFKVYLANAVDSANRLIKYTKESGDSIFISKVKEFANTIIKNLEV